MRAPVHGENIVGTRLIAVVVGDLGRTVVVYCDIRDRRFRDFAKSHVRAVQRRTDWHALPPETW